MKTKILTAALALSLHAFAPPPAVPSYVPIPNLLGWWSCDNTPLDSYIYTLGGATFGSPTPTTDRNSVANSAYSFSGSDYVTVPNDTRLSNFMNMSISVWVKTASAVAVQGLVTKWQQNHVCNGMGDTYGVYLGSNNVDYLNNNNVGAGFPTPAPVAGSLLNTWFHVVCTSDAVVGQKIYINGALAATRPTGSLGSICKTTGPLSFAVEDCLAGCGGPKHRYFTGSLDDIGIWNRVLNECEILALYTSTPPQIACAPTNTFENPPPGDDGGNGGGCCLGNNCGNTQNPLTASYEIPLNQNDFNFSGDASMTDKVNVGYNCNSRAIGKLNVNTDLESDPNGGGDSYSIYATNNNFREGSTNTGVYGSAISNGRGKGGINKDRGVWGYASADMDARGVFGQGGPSQASYGGYFEALNQHDGVTNWGVYAEASGGTNNYGIYATVGGASYSGSGPDWAGYFDGDIYSTTNYSASDRSLKKNIKTMENSLGIIAKLNPVSYNFNVEENKTLALPAAKQYGFISQEIKEILPELTRTAISPAKHDAKGNEIAPKKEILALNYNGFIAILAKGMQEQQTQIAQQQQQIDELKALVQSLAGSTAGKSTSVPVNLSDKNSIVLNQNVPNPFAESTVISYNIPTDFAKAQIIFITVDGKVIKSMDITEKGAGSLNVFANDLTHGVYTYKLVVDGKTIDTKKMVKE